jgi:hypothetical protein
VPAARRAILFVKIPETDPLSDLIIGHVYQLLDHIHSHMSREKGLAGMAENVAAASAPAAAHRMATTSRTSNRRRPRRRAGNEDAPRAERRRAGDRRLPASALQALRRARPRANPACG